jgi:hypothetical protein
VTTPENTSTVGGQADAVSPDLEIELAQLEKTVYSRAVLQKLSSR